MKWIKPILMLIVIAPIAALVWFWVAQNSHATAQLGLDLGSTIGLAWQMPRPMSVTVLMGMSFGVGVLFVSPFWLVWGMMKNRRIKQLERSAGFAGDSL